MLLAFIKVHLEKNCGSTRSMLENSCLWQWTPTRCTPSQEKYPFLRAPQLQHGSQQQMKAPTASSCSRPGWSAYIRSSKGSEKEVLSTIWCFIRREPQSAKGVHHQCYTRHHQYHPALLSVRNAFCLKYQGSNPHAPFPLKSLFPLLSTLNNWKEMPGSQPFHYHVKKSGFYKGSCCRSTEWGGSGSSPLLSCVSSHSCWSLLCHSKYFCTHMLDHFQYNFNFLYGSLHSPQTLGPTQGNWNSSWAKLLLLAAPQT